MAAIDLGWEYCRELRRKVVLGTAIFPQQHTPLNQTFKMEGSDFESWKNWKPGALAAPMISGCIDYVFPAGTEHHQTQFAFEVDRAGPNHGFLPIYANNPTQVEATQLNLAVNPALPKDAD